MRSENLLILLFLYLSLTVVFHFGLPSTLQAQDSNLNTSLSNSLYSKITNNTNDTIQLKSIYGTIRKNRRNLKSEYLPLLRMYANKSLESGYKKGAMKAFDRIGLQYRYDEIFDSALIYHNKSLDLALQLNDNIQLNYNYNNIGQVYRMQDFSVQAIYYFHKALGIAETLGDIKSSSHTMNSLGAAYIVQNNYEQAMYYFRTSMAIAKKLNDKRTLAYNYGSIGEIFLLQYQNDSAMYYFVESKKLIVELGGNWGLAVAEHLIGQAHFALNNLKESEYYFQKALKLHIDVNNNRYQALCYAYLGKIYTIENKVDSAIWYLQKGEDIAQSIHSYENLILISNSMFLLYQKTSEWGKAISSLQQSHAYQDSILNIANAQQIQSLEIEYETNKKEQQIELLSAQNKIKTNRIWLFVVIVISLFLTIVLVILNSIRRKKQSELTHNNLQQQVLRAQMNPHFIFNVLGSIQNFMLQNDNRKASNFLSQFASLIRATLNNSAVETISLSDEITMLKDYIELERMRSNNKFDFQINFDSDLEIDFIQIPPMIIQPFVENSIKHGFNNLNRTGLLKLNIADKTDWIEFVIEDNGSGIQQNITKPKTHQSMAMIIFEKRRKLIQQKFNKNFKFNFLNLEDTNSKISGVKITIEIPVMDND